jgi:uncharacterized protein
MSKKIVITGATGFIGRNICSKLIARGDEITIFTRSVEKAKKIIPGASKYIAWDYSLNDWYDEISGKDAVINLAGESLLSKRWSEEHKNEVRDSRINSTRALVEAIQLSAERPKTFISASAVGFYGDSESEVDELSQKGKGFLAELVNDWEKEAAKVEELNVRRVCIRIGIVLDENDGALAKMILPFRLFVGGPLGSGKQWMPWIHVDDLVNIFLFALDNEQVEGIINGVSPNPVRMNDFAKSIGKVMNRPAIFKVPEFVLKLILGEASKTIITGANVFPGKAIRLGYKFNYSDLEKALEEIFNE